ncbi:MAG: hypothetical protein ACYS30_06330 [Planctomycetota bacterium]|jgi:hypothetical protein
MKKLGYLMITVGFIGGSLTAVVDKENVRWDYFATLLVVGVAGVAFVQTSQRRKSKAEGELVSNMQSVEASLGRIVENITRLNAEKQSINTHDIRHRIDELFLEDLMKFVQARHSIAHAYSLSAYGDVMSCFAAGERYLNRVWSASADGYVDEVNAYLDKAHTQFVDVLQKVRQLAK